MPTAQVLILVDEFQYALDAVDLPDEDADWRAVEHLVLVQDESCEYLVTANDGDLVLWDPEIHWADQQTQDAPSSLREAIAVAAAWLAEYLDQDVETIEVIADPADFGEQGDVPDVALRRLPNHAHYPEWLPPRHGSP